MHWLHTEYLLKGLFLGLLLHVALREAELKEFSWDNPARVGLCMAGGLALALLVAAVSKLRAGYRVAGRLPAFILFLLLESPGLVYTGVLVGLLAGSIWVRGESDPLFIQMALGGVALGVVFTLLRVIKDKRHRLFLCLAMGAALLGIAIYWFGLVEGVEARFRINNPTGFAVFLLMGLPVFYLLTFAGQQEETEVEVGAWCATLGLALALLTRDAGQYRPVAFILPVFIYFMYTMRVMPGLRVFKHVLRGMSHAGVGRFRPALLAFRRALQLDSRNRPAREEFWKVHLKLDADTLARDPQLLALVDFKLCIERAGTLLLETPTAERLAEAHRLLDLVSGQKPVLQPAVNYWRAVARTHERKLDEAVELLATLLDPDKHPARDPARRSVLMSAWQLSLMLHEELRRRVGQPQLALPGRRMEAISTVERHLADNPDDQGVWPLKRLLYQDLTLEEFEQGCVEGKPPEAFDFSYSQQLGAALIEDPVRWDRGVVYLDIAARGLLPHAPTLYSQIAQAYEKAARHQEMWRAYDCARRAGLAMGHKNLAEQERQTFFRAVKLLGEEAMARGDLDAALDHYHTYAEYDRSGVETLRTLAELYERKGDPLAALRITERGLAYNKSDKDFLSRKDRYLVSVSPALLKANLEAAGPELDIDYCLTKARTLLDYQEIDLEVLDWAEQLVTLALVVKPEHRPLRVLKARARWRRGEVEEAAALLEAIRTPKPEKFAGADDEEAWYTACQLLGDLYLNSLNRPQDAVACLNDYRKSPKSGARTYYRLAQAYEQLGDVARAVKCYKQVAAYDGNPLQYEAQDALSRLGQS
jgi:tetratricopeptide (TPR) repeat protein